MWEVPAQFYAMRNTNNPRYLLGDEDSTDNRNMKAREKIVESKAAAEKSRGSVRKQQALQMV